MKIVILADSITTQSAGIHYYGLDFISRMATSYPNNEYIVIATKDLKIPNTQSLVVPVKKYLPLHLRLRQLFSIPRIVNKLAPSIVIELAHFGPFFVNKNSLRVTVVHDLTPIDYPHFHDRMSVIFHKYLFPNILNKSNLLICNSKTTESKLTEKFPFTSGKTCVVYPSVPSVPRAEVNTRNDKYILSVGTFEPRKNYALLVQGFTLYKQQGGMLKLIIAGREGWNNNEFLKALTDSNYSADINLKKSISRDELLQLYANCEAFVSTSIEEGFGIPQIEAMAYSKPLLLSNIKIFREVAGDAANYFDQLDAKSICQSLDALESSAEELSERSKNRFEVLKRIPFKLDFLEEFNS